MSAACADQVSDRGGTEEQPFDMWAAGGAYERYMGRWSRLVADRF
ncbi:hypothetical protein AB0J81_31540 [Streptomyces bobili]